MKPNKLLLIIALQAVTQSAIAGAAAGGSSEVTQIANQIQLILSYEQQVEGYVRQGLQLQNEITNLVKNPASLLGADVGNLINGVGSIMSGANSIGGNLARIDRNFATTFKNPTAATLSQNFTKWHSTSTDTLEGALKSAGMHRDQFASDTDAIQVLYNKSQSTGGNLQALQTLSQINVRQLQQSQALADLIATQNIASSTYMAAQTAKAAESQKAYELISTPYTTPIPPIEQAQSIKWNQILFKK